MGAYLNKPITEKESEVGENYRVRYAASCMQGWRVNQEDAHNCILDFAENCSLFAVYDGHGGSEVAQYTAMHLPKLLKDKESWKSGEYAKAIEEAFLEFDDILRSDEVLEELKVMAGAASERHHEPSDDEDKQALYEEATMPIDAILERYGFALRRDRSGKTVFDLENIQVFRDELERPIKCAKILNEKDFEINGSDAEKLKNVEKSSEENNSVTSSAVNGQVGEEKIKKRLCQSPIDENPKRTKSDKLESADPVMEGTEEKHNFRCALEPEVRISEKATVVGELRCNNLTNVPVTEAVVEKKTVVEVENQDGSKNMVSETTTKTTKSALEIELDRDDNEGTSDITNLRQMDDGNKAQPSTALEAQTAMSSDSEQSFDEDYKEEDEVSEEDEDDEDSEPDEEASYNGPSGDTPGEDSGTTACLVLLFKDKVIVGNAGDSRAVLCRKGKAIDLSVDHKPEDASEKRRIEAAGGEISVDGRVNGGLNLSRALGDHFYKKNNNLPLKDQMISAQPDVTEHSIEQDDEFVVVACDGIWNSLTSQDVVDFVRTRLASGISLKEICEKMCDECLSPNTAGDGTGCDNMTVVIAELLRV